jgi:pectinesterase
MQIPVSNGNRLDNKSGHYRYSDMIAECGLTLGYAVALVEPPLKKYQGLDPMPDVAWRLKAAVRTIRSEASACQLSDRIAVMGFSRSSGQAGILAFSGGLDDLEGDGPHRQFSSRVQAAVLHAGRMDHELLTQSGHPIAKTYISAWGPPVTAEELSQADAAKRAELDQRRQRWRAPSAVTYVTPDDPPTFVCVGEDDEYRPPQMASLAAALSQAKVEHQHVVVPKMKHAVVSDPAVLARIYAFLQQHLHPAAASPEPVP